MGMLKRFSAFLPAVLVAVAFPFPAGAETIMSTDGERIGAYAFLYGDTAQEEGWSQTSTYSDVTITAEIDPGTSPGASGTAYLMTQIGPSTTTAEQIATASFSASGTAGTPVLNTLFDGLTLGPGDYYLVLSSSAGLGWEVTIPGVTPVAAPGASLISKDYGTESGYPPATSFSNVRGNHAEFTVTGAAVPEPSAIILFGVGAVGLLHYRARKRERGRGSNGT